MYKFTKKQIMELESLRYSVLLYIEDLIHDDDEYIDLRCEFGDNKFDQNKFDAILNHLGIEK